MPSWEIVLPGLIGVWLAYHVLIMLSVGVQLLRIPFEATHTRMAAGPPDTRGLPPDQQDWLGELATLGFELVRLGTQAMAPEHYPVALLRHATRPAYAWVTLSTNPLLIYPTFFYGFDHEGHMLVTVNRLGWLRLGGFGPARVHYICVDSLAAHWQAHAERLSDDTDAHADPSTHAERIVQHQDEAFAHMQAAGTIVQSAQAWHARVGVAARSALAWWRHRKALARPFQSRVLQGEHYSSFLAQSLLTIEAREARRPPRHNLKAFVLVMSMVASMILWGMAFTAPQAIAIVLVLFVHECGHAFAMRLFGWRDLSMFFVPLVGAMVTGRPRPLPIWQHTLVLLAGPLPGLIAGTLGLMLLPASAPQAWLDWRQVAMVAVALNLFNLLPLAPLDGGRLLELTLFARWPRARAAFSLLSLLGMAAVTVWTGSAVGWLAFGLLAVMLLGQWRVARLRHAPTHLDAASPEQGADGLRARFDAARRLFPGYNTGRLLVMVKAVRQSQMAMAPRLWETWGAMGCLLAAWALCGALIGSAWPSQARGKPPLTPAQQAFDDAWYEWLDGDSMHQQSPLPRLAAALPPQDPRQVDVAIAQALATKAVAQRHARMADVLQQDRDGAHYTLANMMSEELDTLVDEAMALPAQERLPALHSAVTWVESMRPDWKDLTLPTRLRIVETMDASGQTEAVPAQLTALTQEAATLDDCQCLLRQVLRARTWFHLQHHQWEAAEQVLRQAPMAAHIAAGTDRLSADLAWVWLMQGRTAQAAALMNKAAYGSAYDPDWRARLRGARPRPAPLLLPMDLALMQTRDGHPDQATLVLRQSTAQAHCRAAHTPWAATIPPAPWQQERARLTQALALKLCPAQAEAAPRVSLR